MLTPHHVPFFYVELVHPKGKRPNRSQIHDQFGENQRRRQGIWGWPGGGGARGWKRHCSHSSARSWCCCHCRTHPRSPSTGHRLGEKLAREKTEDAHRPVPRHGSWHGSVYTRFRLDSPGQRPRNSSLESMFSNLIPGSAWLRHSRGTKKKNKTSPFRASVKMRSRSIHHSNFSG